HDARDFFFRGDRLSTGSRRLATYIDDVGALRHHSLSLRHRIVDRDKQPAIAKTIRRNIQNAHDERSLTNGHFEVPDFPDQRTRPALDSRRLSAAAAASGRVSRT